MRAILEFSTENANVEDCVAERGRFEPPNPFRLSLQTSAEFATPRVRWPVRNSGFQRMWGKWALREPENCTDRRKYLINKGGRGRGPVAHRSSNPFLQSITSSLRL